VKLCQKLNSFSNLLDYQPVTERAKLWEADLIGPARAVFKTEGADLGTPAEFEGILKQS
jgi:hypothetical protein